MLQHKGIVMRHLIRIFLLACAFSCMALLAGCSMKSWFSDERTVVVDHDPNSLWNLKVGRDYVAQGRYELAKEHYLMALASSNDHELRNVITQELAAVDLMIQTQR